MNSFCTMYVQVAEAGGVIGIPVVFVQVTDSVFVAVTELADNCKPGGIRLLGDTVDDGRGEIP